MENSLKTADPLSAASAGAVSGFITRLLFQPLDVVKTRFQVEKSKTIFVIFRLIFVFI